MGGDILGFNALNALTQDGRVSPPTVNPGRMVPVQMPLHSSPCL
jgi:hypothetical protein